MPRIADEEIQRLKSEVPLERLCQRYGIELKPTGKNLVGFCPKHEDKTPSFIVTPEKNLWHCMGACNEGGDNIRLITRMENVSFRHAVDILRQFAGTVPKAETVTTHTGTTHPILVRPEAMEDPDLFNCVIDFYHNNFLNIPNAAEYLKKRHCYHPDAVETFRLGYANRTLGYRIPGSTASGKQLKTRLQSLGLIRKSGHEHLSGSVVFPIFTTNGETKPIQMYGRKIKETLSRRTPRHLYLGKPLRGVWNAAALLDAQEWILCEALIDALSCWCHGHRNVTASYGKGNFTADHMDLVRKVRPRKIVIAYDNDPPSLAAAKELAPKLAAEGVHVHQVQLPPGADINEYVCTLAAHNPDLSASNGQAGAIEDTLAGLFATAPVIARPDQTTVTIPAPPSDAYLSACHAQAGATRAHSSSLAASLAAEVEKTSTPGLIVVKDTPEEIRLRIGDPAAKGTGRSYRVRGLARNQAYEVMKINLRVMNGEAFHVDTLDLYNAKHRTTYINTAADELNLKPEIIKKDLAKVLLKLEELQDRQINQTLEPKEETPSMTPKEKEESLALLKDPKLIDRILADFNLCGLVGEETNKLTGYLAAVSRKLEAPLAVLIQSSTAAGKSTLMEAILAMMPEEDRIQYSAMTGQSLFYLGDADLKHRILAIVEEEGARHASYALKLLQSEGHLTIATTGKDPNTGRMVTHEYRVEGPVMILTTSTAIDIDEELLNRCIVLTVDECREQTRAIHQQQRKSETLEGLLHKLDKTDMLKTQRNAQRLLKPVRVVNPYAGQLTFLDDRTRTRRDHKKYLTLIKAITYLHQYQRPHKTHEHHGKPVTYIEVTPADISIANRLAAEVLGRSLDELPPQTRRLLRLITGMVNEACEAQSIDQEHYRFSRRHIREYTGWGNTQLKVHLRRLEDMEYLLLHRGGLGKTFEYELLYKGEGGQGEKFLMGLIDPDVLTGTCDYDLNRSGSDDNRSGSENEKSAPGRPQVGPKSGGCRGAEKAVSANADGHETQIEPEKSKNAYIKAVKKKNRTRSGRSGEQAKQGGSSDGKA